MAAIEIERLIATLEARIDKYEKNLAKAYGTTDKTFTAIEKRGKKMQASLASTFAANFGKGFLIGAAGAVGIGALSEIPGALRKIVGEAAGLVDTANKIGVTTDALQELHFAATQGGASIEDMDKALGFWTKTVGQAAEGGGELAKVLAENGIAIRDSAGKIRDPIELLRAYADVIKNARSEQERARLTTLAFGRSGADLANVFRDGAAGIDAASAALKGMGGVIDRETLQQIAKIDDELDALTTKWELRWKRFALGAVIALDDVADGAGPAEKRLQALLKIVNRLSLTGALMNIPSDFQMLFGDGAPSESNVVSTVRAYRAELQGLAKDLADVAAPFLTAENVLGADNIDVGTQKIIALYRAYTDAKIPIEEFAKGLDEVSKAFPDLAEPAEDMKRLTARIKEVNAALASLPDEKMPNRRAGIAGSALRLRQNVAAGQAGLTEASKDAGLSTAEKRLADEMERLRKAIEKDHPGALVTDDQVRAQAQKNLSLADLNRTIEDYVNDAIKAESGGRGSAKNPNSSATGFGQFIESTWIDLFRRYFPDRAKGMTDALILAQRSDLDDSRKLIEAYARENAAVLQKAGVSVNEAALQLAHFLGAGDAAKVLSAAPGTPLQGLISQTSINANPTVLGGGRTVDDARAYAESRVGGGTAGAQRFDANQNFGAGLDDQKLSVELLKQEIEFRRQLGPITDENRAALLAYQQAAQLLNQAQQDGSAVGLELHDVQQLLHGDLSGLSPAAREQAEAMRALALEYGNTQSAAEQLDTSQEKLQRSSEAVNDIGRDALGTLISDLREGKSAGEALADTLDRIADRLINMALDSLFDTSGGGGGLGSIFGLIGKLFGFDTGGYTGAGTRKQVAGVVHAGEVVFSQADVAAHGGPAAVDAFRRTRRGYAGGGIVTPAAIAAAHRTAQSVMASGPATAAVNMRMVIDLRGANGDETIGRIAREAAAKGADQAYQAAVATSRKSATAWVMQDRANGGGDYRL